jgi:hypothetical protein
MISNSSFFYFIGKVGTFAGSFCLEMWFCGLGEDIFPELGNFSRDR